MERRYETKRCDMKKELTKEQIEFRNSILRSRARKGEPKNKTSVVSVGTVDLSNIVPVQFKIERKTMWYVYKVQGVKKMKMSFLTKKGTFTSMPALALEWETKEEAEAYVKSIKQNKNYNYGVHSITRGW